MKKLTAIAALLLSYPVIANVEDRWEYQDWDTKTFTASTINYKSVTGIDLLLWGVEANVSMSKGGKQSIYFTILADKNGEAENQCYHFDEDKEDIWKFDNQNISMVLNCRKYTGTQQSYLSVFARTNKGGQFIINTFKNAKGPVKITDGEFTVYMPSKGFTDAWNNFGGDAL